jgi:hypothetical protein
MRAHDIEILIADTSYSDMSKKDNRGYDKDKSNETMILCYYHYYWYIVKVHDRKKVVMRKALLL